MEKQEARVEKHRLQFTLHALFLLQLLVAVTLILAQIAPRSAVEIATLTLACMYGLRRCRHQEDQGSSVPDSASVPV